VATFGLVHGAWHGAWCWDRLVPELELRGHRVVAVDLPVSDASAGLRRYADLIAASLGDADDVVLVGHSLGAASIPIAAARRPVRHLVFLCAILPEPGKSVTDRYREEDVFVPGFGGNTVTLDDGASAWNDPASATRCFFHDCTAEDAAWAVARLRPQAAAPRTEPWPLDPIPPVERSSILCRDERCLRPAWSQRVSRELLGVEATELDGGHSPFLSRPAALAEVLCSVT
jgi:pimeloyl-ACP methyl ester carboxylesterase